MATGIHTPKPLELVFRQIDDVDVMMDVYIPASATRDKPAPVLLWWHGGGLIQGTRKAIAPHLLSAPERHGLCIVSADYRLAPQTRLPGVLSDCAAAIAFLRSPAFAAATHERVDGARVVVSGSSAGGWLALLAGTGIGYAACGLEPPRGVAGIAAIYPITGLRDPFWEDKKSRLSWYERVITHDEVASFLDPAASKTSFSPGDSDRAIFYFYMVQEGILASLLFDGTGISPDILSVAENLKSKKFSTPMTYIIHGTIDTKVPVRQATDVVAALKEIGAPVEYVEMEVEHGFDNSHVYRMGSMYTFIDKVFQ